MLGMEPSAQKPENSGPILALQSSRWADKRLIVGAMALLTALNLGVFAYNKGLVGDSKANDIESTNTDVKMVDLNFTPFTQDTVSAATIPSDIVVPGLPPATSKSEDQDVETPKLAGPSILSGSQHETLDFDKDAVLDDADGRIHDAFDVTPTLRNRVSFWFDVYTKYDENKRVVHYSNRPWIVFKVIDVSDIINASTPRRRWMRNEKADKFVKAEAKKIRLALASVARKKNLNKLNAYEKMVVEALKPLGGKVQTHARLAATNTRVQTGQKNFFEEGLKISNRYLPEMEEIFAKQKLPIELTRLPLVESSFNKFATSKDGAAGIWQFMGNTGSKFMLINDQIDERRSPFKASEAAAKLLKENHLILHRQWPLALTAYNHGPGGVRAAVKATKTKDLGTIALKYRTKMFNFASSNFYSCFLAAMHAQMYKDKIWGDLQTEPSLNTHFVRLSKPYRASKIMKLTGLSTSTLVLHNPDLKKILEKNGVLPTGLRLYVPDSLSEKVQKLFAQADTSEQRKTRRKG